MPNQAAAVIIRGAAAEAVAELLATKSLAKEKYRYLFSAQQKVVSLRPESGKPLKE